VSEAEGDGGGGNREKQKLNSGGRVEGDAKSTESVKFKFIKSRYCEVQVSRFYIRGCIDKILGKNISPKIKCKVWIL